MLRRELAVVLLTFIHLCLFIHRVAGVFNASIICLHLKFVQLPSEALPPLLTFSPTMLVLWFTLTLASNQLEVRLYSHARY